MIGKIDKICSRRTLKVLVRRKKKNSKYNKIYLVTNYYLVDFRFVFLKVGMAIEFIHCKTYSQKKKFRFSRVL